MMFKSYWVFQTDGVWVQVKLEGMLRGLERTHNTNSEYELDRMCWTRLSKSQWTPLSLLIFFLICINQLVLCHKTITSTNVITTSVNFQNKWWTFWNPSIHRETKHWWVYLLLCSCFERIRLNSQMYYKSQPRQVPSFLNPPSNADSMCLLPQNLIIVLCEHSTCGSRP